MMRSLLSFRRPLRPLMGLGFMEGGLSVLSPCSTRRADAEGAGVAKGALSRGTPTASAVAVFFASAFPSATFSSASLAEDEAEATAASPTTNMREANFDNRSLVVTCLRLWFPPFLGSLPPLGFFCAGAPSGDATMTQSEPDVGFVTRSELSNSDRTSAAAFAPTHRLLLVLSRWESSYERRRPVGGIDGRHREGARIIWSGRKVRDRREKGALKTFALSFLHVSAVVLSGLVEKRSCLRLG
eukprot:CAMPEP_0183304488 /NCGR_PEP_ID=MMETSP0160_2-20130417/9559_1 /TAXON_ID=2839 ORGANISM="Odontella Sinensis, Strain Grunow 1884" /NCGR_SAMPLE_ID=MMETSP0160_2 /ASSEMBLY_ACC=CAM_ASM_000250 /LENGTH=241 /DNA_ID=CAMNT_0025467547 /DNA_START=211 /DNA_END=933 /DNA_ORIENTATION=-